MPHHYRFTWRVTHPMVYLNLRSPNNPLYNCPDFSNVNRHRFNWMSTALVGCWKAVLKITRFFFTPVAVYYQCAQHNVRKEVIHAMNPENETTTERNTEQYIFAVATYKLLAFTIGTIGVFGFCNNVIVIILFYKFKRLRTPTNLLLVNISVSDILVSLFGINFTFVSCIKCGWIWNSATCIWDGFSNSLFGKNIIFGLILSLK